MTWIIVKFNIATGRMRYFGPFETKEKAEAWAREAFGESAGEYCWGATTLEKD